MATSRFDDLLDTLLEARRYVRSHPDEARRLVDLARRQILDVIGSPPGDRIEANLYHGSRFIHHAPDVLRGYIDGAILEIQDHETILKIKDYEAKNK